MNDFDQCPKKGVNILKLCGNQTPYPIEDHLATSMLPN
jgi:hypothetical protein